MLKRIPPRFVGVCSAYAYVLCYLWVFFRNLHADCKAYVFKINAYNEHTHTKCTCMLSILMQIIYALNCDSSRGVRYCRRLSLFFLSRLAKQKDLEEAS